MNCKRCGKWAGAYAGFSYQHDLCQCAVPMTTEKPKLYTQAELDAAIEATKEKAAKLIEETADWTSLDELAAAIRGIK